MAKTIILARHSYAENSSFETNDFERSLTAQGVKYANQQSLKLAERCSSIDLLVSSDAKRAMQTADVLSKQIDIKQEISLQHFLYEDYTTQQFIDYIHTLAKDLNQVLIVGHNPTLATMAYRLVPEFNYGVSPGTIIIIEFDGDNWLDIQVGEGKLINVIA